MKIGKMKIVITENEDFSPEVIQCFNTLGQVNTYDTKTRQELIQNISNAELIFIRLRFVIDKEIIDSNPNLKYILTATTGLDHIDVAYFESKGGKIISLKGEVEFLNSIPSTAEHTWGLLLALMRNTCKAANDVLQGNWRRDLFKGNNLSGKKIGILGLGRVGKQIANYAKAFNMQVAYYDIQEKETENLLKCNTPEELFKWADVISIHIPLNDNTIHFIDNKLLSLLKPTTVIINTSRGAVINEQHLIEHIENNKIKGYATDVLENELHINMAQNKLVSLANKGYNIIITPHIAGAAYESMHMTENFILKKFQNNLN